MFWNLELLYREDYVGYWKVLLVKGTACARLFPGYFCLFLIGPADACVRDTNS